VKEAMNRGKQMSKVVTETKQSINESYDVI
jgi:hypothetical protein